MRSFRWSIGSALSVSFAIGAGALIFICGLSYQAVTELGKESAEAAKCEQTLRLIGYLRTDLEEAQTAVRGYLISSDEAFLTPYERMVPEIKRDVAKLRAHTKGDHDQEWRLDDLERILPEALAFLDRMVETHAEGGRIASAPLVAGHEADRQMELLRILLKEMAGYEHQEMEEHRIMVAREERRMRMLLTGTTAGALLLLMAVVLFLNKESTRREAGEQRLRESQKLESVGRLAGGIAHDFNNILTSIIGAAEHLWQSLPAGASHREDVDEIVKSARRAAALTKQLLAFSRQQVMAPRILDLNSVVSNAEKMLRRVIRENIDFSVMLDPQLGAVLADPCQIEQVLLNLVLNGRDAMPDGGRLSVQTKNVTLDRGSEALPPGNYVMLAVSDTGQGMTAEVQQRIFEPFFTTKEHGKGTGLGLPMVHGIVRQSGGHIEVYSAPGVGSAFTVYLPRVNALTERPQAEAPRTPRASGSETILLVEDEETVRKVARRALTRAGYMVLEAGSPQAALALAERVGDPIHLLVTDVVMPGMDGLELAGKLSRARPGLKVVLMSGYPERSRSERLSAPDAHYLSKPFDSEELLRVVRGALDRGGEAALTQV